MLAILPPALFTLMVIPIALIGMALFYNVLYLTAVARTLPYVRQGKTLTYLLRLALFQPHRAEQVVLPDGHGRHEVATQRLWRGVVATVIAIIGIVVSIGLAFLFARG